MPSNSEKHIKFIQIKGARVHNLKNIDINIPLNKFIVVTGLSGSGKSTLAFDTLYAEGQRRYVESLSSYARQFLGRMNKPEVDYIKGIPPAVAIEQKVNTRNPRSTVGTSTELYDYLKILFARIGKTFSPISGKEVEKHNISNVTNYILNDNVDGKFFILAPIFFPDGRKLNDHLSVLSQQGFSRIFCKGEIIKISDFVGQKKRVKSTDILLVIDRIIVKADDKDLQARIDDSVQTALYEGHGECLVYKLSDKSFSRFTNRFEADGISFEEPSVDTFSFNTPLGACPKCEGFGRVVGIDPDLVIPNKHLSIYEEAVACWKGTQMSSYKNELIQVADELNIPIHTPYYKLSKEQKDLIWTGNGKFTGIFPFFEIIEGQRHKIQYRVMLSRYRGKTICAECGGTRLKKEASYIKVGNYSINEMVNLPLSDLRSAFQTIELDERSQKIGKRLLVEINSRLDFLNNVGLGYLTLNRQSASLSGGESQRINLATSLGSSLVGSLYILDEPSIGLHPRDTKRLIDVVTRLQRIGNTVLVVEHDEDIIRAADEIIDIGPAAGSNGGEIVFQGSYQDYLKADCKPDSCLTLRYLTKELRIEIPKIRRKTNSYIEINGAYENNLKNVDVKFPLNTLTVITGVSGSGKTSLVKNVFYNALKNHLSDYPQNKVHFAGIKGDLSQIQLVEFIDQNPIGKSSRSNPATYVKAYDEIRQLYASLPRSKTEGYTPGTFSFNVEGGRCAECEGDGHIKVDMQFMADVKIECEACRGKRFKDDVLEVQFNKKNIYEILDMTIDEAIDFFKAENKTISEKIVRKLEPLQFVGLGYLKMGQASSTLSGGESQRIKLASYIGLGSQTGKILFIFDEPTTGLHFHDIKKLLKAFNALIDNGHSLIVIEHNQEIIKSADWIIDIGSEGGDKGGNIVFTGTPEQIVDCKESYTGKYLKPKLV